MPLLPPPLHTHAQPGDSPLHPALLPPLVGSLQPRQLCHPPFPHLAFVKATLAAKKAQAWATHRTPSGPEEASKGMDPPAGSSSGRRPPHRRLLPSCASRASLQGSGRVRLPGTGRPPHRGGSPAHLACTRTAPGNARCLSRALPGDTGVCRSERSEGGQRRPRAERTLTARQAQTRPPRAHASPLASPAGATSSHGGYEATCGWDIECHNGPSDRLGNRKLTRDGD